MFYKLEIIPFAVKQSSINDVSYKENNLNKGSLKVTVHWMFKGLESEIRLSEQVPSSFLREITMIKLLFLVLVAATYLAKGGDLKDQNTLQKSTSQVIQVLIFFQELARTLISESFDQETKQSL